jgi:protein-S-isoprenylcysteine O-methyltransferase Ste14
VQPSSLIFLVIVAIWVAYLIQHWVRRREQLATARSVDKFSEAMRVLERRNPLPTSAVAESSTSAATLNGKEPRPEAVVTSTGVSSPLRARSRGESPLPPAHPVPIVELTPHRSTAQIVLRRVRAILFLAAVLAVPVTLVLSIAHVLKWLSVGLALAALVGSVVWLRVAAIQEQKERRSRRLQKRHLQEARARVAATARPSRVVSPAVKGDDPGTPVAEETLGGWKPVPVPPPTYTLKEPAYRPEREATASVPVPIDVEDDDVEAAPVPRRVVGR